MACVVNAAQFRRIDDRTWGGYKAIHRYGNPDLLKVGRRENGIVKQLYGLAFALRDAAPGATIYIPKGDSQTKVEFRAHLLTYGAAKKLVPLRYDPTKFAPDLSLSAHSIATTPSGFVPHQVKRSFAILARASSEQPKGAPIRTAAREFILLRRGTLDLLVDISLVEGEFKRLRVDH